jgi:hypothetical protein
MSNIQSTVRIRHNDGRTMVFLAIFVLIGLPLLVALEIYGAATGIHDPSSLEAVAKDLWIAKWLSLSLSVLGFLVALFSSLGLSAEGTASEDTVFVRRLEITMLVASLYTLVPVAELAKTYHYLDMLHS